MGQLLQFPNRDPYSDFTPDEITVLLQASINIVSGKTSRRTSPRKTGTDAKTITPIGTN